VSEYAFGRFRGSHHGLHLGLELCFYCVNVSAYIFYFLEGFNDNIIKPFVFLNTFRKVLLACLIHFFPKAAFGFEHGEKEIKAALAYYADYGAGNQYPKQTEKLVKHRKAHRQQLAVKFKEVGQPQHFSVYDNDN
jgi:hypothetical protein